MNNSEIKIDVKATQGRRDGGYITGKMVVAMPWVDDVRYRHSVILIYEHNPDGAKGFQLNASQNRVHFSELTRQLNIACQNPPDVTLYQGGVVENMRGFVLHSPDRHYRTSLKITNDLMMTSHIEPLNEIANRIGPKERLVLLGHFVWGAGELDRELAENQWLIMDADSTLVFDHNIDTKWQMALQKMNINPGAISLVNGVS